MQTVTDPKLIETLNAKRGVSSFQTVTDEELIGKLNAKAAVQRQKPVEETPEVPESEVSLGQILADLKEGISTSFDKRRTEVGDTFEAWLNPELGQQISDIEGQETPRALGAGEALTQIIGKGGFGGFWDVGGETLVSGVRGLGLLVPDDVEDSIKQEMLNGIKWIEGSPKAQTALQAINMGQEAYGAWKAENPQDAKTLESVVNIGMAFVPGPKKAPVTSPVARTTPSILDTAGRASSRLSGRMVKKRAATAAEDLIDTSHIKTKKKIKQRADNTTVSRFGSKVTTLSPEEKAVADTIGRLPLIKRKMSNAYYSKNRSVIDKALNDEARRLEKVLKRKATPVSSVDLKQKLRIDGGKMIADNKTMQSKKALADQFQFVEDRALDIFSKHEPNTLGLLKARREFDDWVTSVKSENAIFGEGAETAFKQSVNSARRSMNGLLNDMHGGQFVKQSLYKQSNYHRALDIIDPKADNEAISVIGRLAQNVHNVTKIHMPTTPLAAMATIGGTGTLIAGYAPLLSAAAVVGGTGLMTGKALRSPKTYKALGESLQLIDKAIKMSTNKEMIKQLRLDRAALIELAQLAEDDSNPSPSSK